MTLQVESPCVYTSQGVPISVTGIAQVKIQGQNEDMLLTACEQFLGKNENEIQHIALVTLEGHQRAIMGSMTVEEIYKDRKKFSKQVFEVASSDLVNMGITVVSYTLKDIRDEEVGIHNLSFLFFQNQCNLMDFKKSQIREGSLNVANCHGIPFYSTSAPHDFHAARRLSTIVNGQFGIHSKAASNSLIPKLPASDCISYGIPNRYHRHNIPFFFKVHSFIATFNNNSSSLLERYY